MYITSLVLPVWSHWNNFKKKMCGNWLNVRFFFLSILNYSKIWHCCGLYMYIVYIICFSFFINTDCWFFVKYVKCKFYSQLAQMNNGFNVSYICQSINIEMEIYNVIFSSKFTYRLIAFIIICLFVLKFDKFISHTYNTEIMWELSFNEWEQCLFAIIDYNTW